MASRLTQSISPYLRAHADNPVDWWPWGHDAFAQAAERDVPVFISIGYATCHWCHVMARESFSDPSLAAYLADNFVSIKVDREEHPSVDASYLAQAAAFTEQLGWPLSIFATPDGQAFYAGTYFPPQPTQGQPSFQQVLEAVTDAWKNRRDEALQNASVVADALRSTHEPTASGSLPSAERVFEAAQGIAPLEDARHGGFGSAPKFPVAPVLQFLLTQGAAPERLAIRTLETMAASPLRDSVEGGFFRYATQSDWSEPHYERMLYDNALLLQAYTSAWQRDTTLNWAPRTAAGIAAFLTGVMQQPSGAFASAQDSESTIDGTRSEGGYYLRDRAARASLTPPARDEKVLTGWNGLAIEALARAGRVFAQPEWISAARRAADYLLSHHVTGDGYLVRASISREVSGETEPSIVVSGAASALEDYGMLANALIELASVTGEPRYLSEARRLIDDTIVAGEAARTIGAGTDSGSAPVFAEPGGADPVLAAHNLVLANDPSEGAYPSGLSSTALAAQRLYGLTGDVRYSEAATRALASVSDRALENPIAFGTTALVLGVLAREPSQLVVVTPDDDTVRAYEAQTSTAVRTSTADVVVTVTDAQAHALAGAGFLLFDGQTSLDGAAIAYACTAFVCQLPVPVSDLDPVN